MRSAGFSAIAGVCAIGLVVAVVPIPGSQHPAQAAFPGTNGDIACEGQRNGSADVYTMNPDGSDKQFLTDSNARDGDPAWSPSGEKLTFESYRNDAASEAYKMNADGSGVTRLTFNGSPEDRGTAWSPDADRIAFHSTREASDELGGSDFDVYTMNPDGSDPVNVTDGSSFDAQPDWSPKGDKLVFNTDRDGPFNIYAMNPDGTGLQRLTNSPAQDSGPVWSPDGSQVAFQSLRSGTFEIYRMDADGSNVTQLTNNNLGTFFDTFDAFPEWSPDGERIIWTSGRDSDMGDYDVFSMDAKDGSDVRRLTERPGFDGRCDWQRATPTSKKACKDEGWRDFNRPGAQRFANQGECVSFVEG
jgi:TolB protein